MPQFNVSTFKPGDLSVFEPQESQASELDVIEKVDWGNYWKSGFALTGWMGETPIAFGGIVEVHPGIGECWLFISRHASHREMIYLVKGFKRLLQCELSTGYHRVQMYARADFKPAVRMAKLIGMKQEGFLEHYPRKGIHSFLFGRTRND